MRLKLVLVTYQVLMETHRLYQALPHLQRLAPLEVAVVVDITQEVQTVGLVAEQAVKQAH